jgi:hypothetical protein
MTQTETPVQNNSASPRLVPAGEYGTDEEANDETTTEEEDIEMTSSESSEDAINWIKHPQYYFEEGK